MSDTKFNAAVSDALLRLGKGIAITDEITSGTKAVVAAALSLSEKRGVDVSDLLIGDELADRALLNAAAIEGELQAEGVDWSALPGVVFEIAFDILTVVGNVAALL